jgi:hypothetical protein
VRGVSTSVACIAGIAFAGPASAQVAANRATTYLVPSDVTDARAVWVNPGALAATPEASVALDLTVANPGARGRLAQISAGLDARGFAFGYQRNVFPNGDRGHTYRLGLGGKSGGLAVGFAAAFHGGAIRGTGWDVGARYDWRPEFTLGGVVRNLGRPTVLGVRQEVILLPAITVRPLGASLALSGEAAFTTTVARGYGVQASFGPGARSALGIIARLDTDRSWHRTAFTLALSLGRRDRVGLTGTMPEDLSRLGTASVYGLSTRTPGR